MTTDPFADAARAEAERMFQDGVNRTYNIAMKEGRAGFIAGARWARDHSAAQDPTDAECLAVLNVAIVPLGEPPKRNGLDDWNPAAVERVRAALSAARRDEEKR